MEISLPKTVCSYLHAALYEPRSQELTQEIRLSDGMPDIGSVVGAWGQVVLRSKQWSAGEISVSGGVMAWVLYLPENGSQPRCLENWIPFHMSWPLDERGREGSIRLHCLLRFADARSTSARKLMLRLGVGVLAEAMVPREITCSVPGQVPDGVQLLKSTYPVRIPKEAGEKPFLMDDTLSLPDSCPRPERILYYTLDPQIQEKKVVGNKVVFRGNGNLHLMYLSEEGQLHSWDFELPFSQFSDLDGIYEDTAQADVQMCVTSLELELDDESSLRLKAGLLGQYLVDDRQLLELVEDAYSTAGQLEPEREMLELPVILEHRNQTIPVRQVLPREVNLVADTASWQDFPRQHRSGEQISWEIPGQFQLLYYSSEGALKSASVKYEEELHLQAHEETGVRMMVQGIRNLQAVAGAEEIRVSGELPVILETGTRQRIPMVTGFQLTSGKTAENGRPSLILRRVGEDRLWDIAKSTGSTVEAIRSANGLEAEPEETRILLIPIVS